MKKEKEDSFEELQKKKKRKLQSSEERMKELNNPAKSAYTKGSKKNKKKSTHKVAKRVGIVLVILQLILSVVFLGILFSLNLLPFKFSIIVVIALLFLFLFVFFTQRRHKGKATPGKIISIIVCIILAAGSYYLGMVNGAFGKIVGGTYKVDNMVVAVLDTDSAETLEDVQDYVFGVQYALGGADIQETLDAINKELGKEVATSEYSNMEEQVNALYDGEVGAIIYNEGYAEILDEIVEEEQKSIKIIYSYEIQKKIESNNAVKAEDVDVNNNTFNVYLSGIDVYGAINRTSRSDVNIIATVNTDTHQILLTTTPRDYYVTIPGVSNGEKDKLTHAGIYGVDASIATLENLYETTIPFYARVNFTSIMDIVDALGGVDVYSEYAFKTISGTTVQKGLNHFNGEEALAFARERKNLSNGDYQRGKNQQALIVAMIQKLISPQILMGASDIINSVGNNVETNMSQDQIQQLIKSQLNEGGSWSIYSVAAEGEGKNDYTYSIPGRKLYVSEPKLESVETIKDLMNRVKNGEKLDGSVVAE